MFKAIKVWYYSLQGRRRITPSNLKALAKYVAAMHALQVAPPGPEATVHRWYAFGPGWSFEDAVLFIDARKIWNCTGVYLMDDKPEQAIGALLFYANP
jgi:hypothetical protein